MEVVHRHITHQDWIILVLILIGLGIVFVRLLNAKRLKSLLSLPYSKVYFSDYEASSGEFFKWFNLTLSIISLLTLGLFISVLINLFLSPKTPVNGTTYLKIIGMASMYFIAKITIEYIIAWLMEIQQWYQGFLYKKYTYLNSFHLISLIILLPALFYFKNQTTYFYFAAGFYLILLIFRYIQIFRLYYTSVFRYLFYFILYLCTLEIAPLILIYKWAVD